MKNCFPKPYLRNRSNRTKHTASLATAMFFLGCLFLSLAPTAIPAQNKTTSLNVWSRLGPDQVITELEIDPTDPDIIYAVSASGLFKTTDGGASWSKKALSPVQIAALTVDFLNPNTLHAGTYSSSGPWGPNIGKYLFKSTDGGETWSNRNSPIDFNIPLLVMDPTSPQTLYAGSNLHRINEGGLILHKSTDGGESWKSSRTKKIRLTFFGSTGWAINPADSQTIYAPGYIFSGGEEIYIGLLKSTDGGESWSAAGLSSGFANRVAIDPSNPNTLYASVDMYDGFYDLAKSTDGGLSWFSINNGLGHLSDAGSYLEQIIVDPDDPNILFLCFSVGLTGGGVFWSVDGGASWSEFSTGLTDLRITDLAIDPSGNRLYAATNAGIFVSQFAAPCINPLSPTGQSFDSSGGTGQIRFEASNDCSWTIASHADWLTVTPGSSGAGDGTVGYSVAPNESTASRKGIISIGGRPFTTTQAGVPVRINSATVSGKKLLVTGENFDPGAVILLNGVLQKTKNDKQNPTTTVISKKAGKKVMAGDRVQVVNLNGSVSEEFTFTGL